MIAKSFRQEEKEFFYIYVMNVSISILHLVGLNIFGLVATIAARNFQSTELRPRALEFLISLITSHTQFDMYSQY